MNYLTNTVKSKLKNNKTVIGSWLSLPSMETCEIISMSQAFDFLVIDVEHSPIQLESIQKLNMVIEGKNIFPFVRLGDKRSITFKRVLETGCYGLVVPNVSSKNDIQLISDHIYYKPRGKRGAGLSRAQGYGMRFNEYCASNTFLSSVAITRSFHAPNSDARRYTCTMMGKPSNNAIVFPGKREELYLAGITPTYFINYTPRLLAFFSKHYLIHAIH